MSKETSHTQRFLDDYRRKHPDHKFPVVDTTANKDPKPARLAPYATADHDALSPKNDNQPSDEDTNVAEIKKEIDTMKKEMQETKKTLQNCRHEVTRLVGRVTYLESFVTKTQEVPLNDQQFVRAAANSDQDQDALIVKPTPDLLNYTTFLEAEGDKITSKLHDLENCRSGSNNRKHLYSSDSDDDTDPQRKETTKRHKPLRETDVSQ